MARKKQNRKAQPEARRPKGLTDGQRTYQSGGRSIVTHQVGAVPILNRLLERMQLERLLTRHLPPDDGRTKIDTPRIVLLLLKNLLVSREPMSGVPIYFQTSSGNVADDQTHQATWKLMAKLVQRPDFVYVADCKLATTANMNEIARLGGRFITVLSAALVSWSRQGRIGRGHTFAAVAESHSGLHGSA